MVESFAWMMWNSVIFMSLWGIYGVVLLNLIIGAFGSLRCRRVFLRVVLPQVSIVCVLWEDYSGSIQKIFIYYIYWY
ncbi:Uncharacterised protein [Salmonella enterica]|nr:Uncharacterised protein [Salmonella enterica]